MSGFTPHGTRLLKQPLLSVVASTMVLLQGCSPTPDSAAGNDRTSSMATETTTRSERLARTIREYDAQGIHRTGTEVDQNSARWLAELIREAGFEPVLEPFDFERLDTLEAYLEVARDGQEAATAMGKADRYDGIPLFDCASYTDADGITAPLAPIGTLDDPGTDGAIEVLRLPPRAHAIGAFREVRTSKARSGVVVVTGGGDFDLPEGTDADPLPEGYALINANRFAEPFGGPVLQLPSQAGPALVQARQRGALARLVISTERTTTTVYNVTTTVPGRDDSAAPIMIMTPRSGWWYNASERGGGLAIFVELLHALRDSPPDRTVHFVASTGHELGHIGLDHYLESRNREIEGALIWLHLGANFAAANGGGIRLQASDHELIDATLEAMAARGIEPDSITPVDQRPLGEARNIFDGDGRYLSLLGKNGLFHSPEDRWPNAVDTRLLDDMTEVVIDQILELTQSN